MCENKAPTRRELWDGGFLWTALRGSEGGRALGFKALGLGFGGLGFGV